MCLMFAGTVFGQDTRVVDSLKSVLAKASGQQRYDVLFGLFVAHLDKDNPQALYYAREATTEASRSGDSLGMVKSGRAEGYVLTRLGRNEEAIRIFHRTLDVASRNKFDEQEKFLLNHLAITYTYQANYDRALEYHFRSLLIREAKGTKSEVSITKNNIGLVYYRLKDFDKALDYYQQSLDIKKEIGDNYDRDRSLINIALCYQQLRKYERVPEYIEEAFSICEPNCSNLVQMEGHAVLGIANLMMEKYEVAENEFKLSHAKAVELGDVRYLAECLWGFSRIDFAKGDYQSALRKLTEAEKYLVETKSQEDLLRVYKAFSDVYNSMGDFRNTSSYQMKYIQLKDSVYSEDLIKNLARVQTDYEERENIKTIEEKNEILVLNQEVIERQRQVYFFVGLVAVLSIFGTYMFLRYSRALSRAKQELSVMNQTLERRVEDRTKALQNVNNELDNFIYKTSHDIRGPLASLKGIANVALLELTDPKAQDYLNKLDASADKLNSILTRLLIVNQINHAVLSPQRIDFKELIGEILVFERKKGVPPRMSILHEIDEDVALVTDRHVLRIILENLIDNAIKYHNSSERIEPFVKINVGLVPDGVSIKVIDNGIGIQERDPQKLFQMFVRASERSESGGIGLYLTKLASERLFAKVEYTTTPERYTQFSVTLPADLNTVLRDKDSGKIA